MWNSCYPIFKDFTQELIDNVTIYDPMFSDFIANNGQLLLDNIEHELDLEKFFTYEFADFGYLVFIAQNTCKNITLFLGIIHGHNLSQYLEKIGYKTIFEIGDYNENELYKNIIYSHRSQEDYQEFFTKN